MNAFLHLTQVLRISQLQLIASFKTCDDLEPHLQAVKQVRGCVPAVS
jgi:hypothetical protein